MEYKRNQNKKAIERDKGEERLKRGRERERERGGGHARIVF
jgi:hypothetical protein